MTNEEIETSVNGKHLSKLINVYLVNLVIKIVDIVIKSLTLMLKAFDLIMIYQVHCLKKQPGRLLRLPKKATA